MVWSGVSSLAWRVSYNVPSSMIHARGKQASAVGEMRVKAVKDVDLAIALLSPLAVCTLPQYARRSSKPRPAHRPRLQELEPLAPTSRPSSSRAPLRVRAFRSTLSAVPPLWHRPSLSWWLDVPSCSDCESSRAVRLLSLAQDRP